MVISICNVAFESKWQITNSGFNTSNPVKYLLISPALNSLEFSIETVTFSLSNSSTTCLNLTCFRFKIMLVTSSLTPGTVANSCSTPSILIVLIAKPSNEERRIRRKALPTVIPKPGSSGRNSNLPNLESASNINTLSGF